MDFSQKLFKNKSFSDLLEEIYDNSRKKEKLIRDLIDQLKPMVKEPGDAMLLVPVIKEYLEVGIKNDEHLIKMAGIVQRAMAMTSTESTGDILSEEDKKSLYTEIHKIAPVKDN